MRIEFESQEHVYSVNGDIATISVTELLKKHGLAPNYDGVDKAVLRASAEKGKEIHKDLENVLNKVSYEPTTAQGQHFAEWVKENLDCGVGEQMLAYEEDGFILAGTADVMAFGVNGETIIGDHKNTTVLHREYVSWQVSLLDYMARKLGDEKINGNTIYWRGTDKFLCFLYDNKNGDMKVCPLEKVSDDEIERLILCERKGEIYQRPMLVIDNELQQRIEEAEKFLLEKEKEYKQAEETAKVLRAQLCKLMEEQRISKWETDNIRVTYIAPTERVAVDSRKLKDKYPIAYSECQKVSKVKGYIKIEELEQGENENGNEF